MVGFLFDGGFHTMTEPDFYIALPFCFVPRKNEKQVGHWPEKQAGCKR
jgi:hypothetical protein